MDTLLAAVFERLPLPIVVIDGEGRVLAANPSAVRAGVIPERVEPHRLTDLMREKGWARAHTERARDGWPLPLDPVPSFRPVTFTRAIGDDARHLEATVTPLEGAARKAVAVVAFMEVAGRRAGTRRDRTIEDKYRLLFEHSPDGVFLSRQDGTILAANPAVCALLGWTEDEFRAVGRAGILVHDGALARALFERRTSGRVRADLSYRHKDGHVVIGDTTSVVIPGTGPEPDALTIVRDATEQRRAEEAVRERNEYIETVLENAPIGFAVNTISDGRARFVSRRFEAVYGQPPGSLTSVDDFFEKVFHDPGYRAKVRTRMLTDMASGDPERMRWEELMTTTVEGDTRFVTAVNIPLPDRDLMVSTAQDVTDRVLAQRAAREKSADLDRFFDLASDLLVIADLDGRFHRVSRGWTAAVGWSIDDLTARRFLDFVHPDDVEATRGALAALQQGGVVSNLVNRYRCRDGSYRWLEWRAAAHDGRWVFGVGRDITDRRKQEEALLHSETRFEGLVEAANDAIFVQTDGRFAYVNEAALRLFGADASHQLLGQPVIERFHPDFRDIVAERIRLLNQLRTPVPLLEETCLRLDGTPVPAEVAAAPIVYDGRPGAVVVARDVTARKKLEAQLVQAQRMESVGRLAGGVAHDFNNMLSIIMGYAELRLSMTPPSDPARDDLEEILAAARKSADLTRQLLAFARRQTIRPQVLDLNACVASTLKMLQRLVGEDISLRWRPAGDLWPVSIDPSQVDQILANLVVNSRDAMPQGGLITIDTSNELSDEAFGLRHPGGIPGEYVRLTVSDTGTGMPGSVVRQVFEPFFTTKPPGEGTGLGLATVYGIVRQHGGFIDVYSEEGVGTVFKLWFPRFVWDPQSDPRQGPSESLPRGTETVLLVEDEEVILKLGRTMLSMLGYEVLTAVSPKDALDIAASYQRNIDLLITDVIMPGMNGRELADRMMQQRQGLRCLYISGYTADVIAHRGVLEPGVHLVQKPFSLLALAKGVRGALETEAEPPSSPPNG